VRGGGGREDEEESKIVNKASQQKVKEVKNHVFKIYFFYLIFSIFIPLNLSIQITLFFQRQRLSVYIVLHDDKYTVTVHNININ
jgi:hypothetical protein